MDCLWYWAYCRKGLTWIYERIKTSFTWRFFLYFHLKRKTKRKSDGDDSTLILADNLLSSGDDGSIFDEASNLSYVFDLHYSFFELQMNFHCSSKKRMEHRWCVLQRRCFHALLFFLELLFFFRHFMRMQVRRFVQLMKESRPANQAAKAHTFCGMVWSVFPEIVSCTGQTH